MIRVLLFQLFVLLLWSVAYVTYAGFNLYFESPMPDSVDVLFTMGGHSTRAEYSDELRQKYNCLWVASMPTPTQMERSEQWQSILEKASILPAKHSSFGELDAFKGFVNDTMSDRTTLNIVIVSEAYHMRRARLVATRLFKHSNHKLIYLSVPQELDTRNWQDRLQNGWWQDHWLRREAVKNLYYFLFGYKLPLGHSS